MTLTLQQLTLTPGQQLLLNRVNWCQLESILDELGEKSSSRISYSNGWLEIMVPLPEHERIKEIIGELIRIMLDNLEVDFEPLGSTTFKNVNMQQAVEPDASFYIQNKDRVVGRNKIDLATGDPPPDLVIEVDITSRTTLDNYQTLGMPELWRYGKKGLEIYLLEDKKYSKSNDSLNFRGLPIIDIINEFVAQAQTIGRTKTIKNFKQYLSVSK